MKKTVSILVAALCLAFNVTAFAEVTQAEKDECLLASKNCAQQVEDIYGRMQRLDKEIKKGTRVYTPEELKKLQDKLTETQELLDTLEKPGH